MPQKPQTIHRCILQSQETAAATNGITCHVCGFDYDTYHRYLQHLIDASCLTQIKTSSNSSKSEASGSGSGINSTIVNLCPHFAAATQTTPIPAEEHLLDQATLATLKVELATLLSGLVGSATLQDLGYPNKDILDILHYLIPPKGDSCSMDATCSRLEAILNPVQLKYRKLKSELASARLCTVQLLEMCLPERRLWRIRRWDEKPVETILAEIIQSASSSSASEITSPAAAVQPIVILD